MLAAVMPLPTSSYRWSYQGNNSMKIILFILNQVRVRVNTHSTNSLRVFLCCIMVMVQHVKDKKLLKALFIECLPGILLYQDASSCITTYTSGHSRIWDNGPIFFLSGRCTARENLGLLFFLQHYKCCLDENGCFDKKKWLFHLKHLTPNIT